MFNLIMKDFSLVKKFNIFVFIYIIFISFMGATAMRASSIFYIIAIFLMAYVFTLYSNGYDDKNKSDIVLNSLPINRKDIVIAKYLELVLVILFGGSIIVIISNLFWVLPLNLVGKAANYTNVFVAYCFIGILFSLYYPFYFKFGGFKMRNFNLVIYIIILLMPSVLSKWAKNNMDWAIVKWLINLDTQGIGVLLIIVTTIALVISMLMSVGIYNNKDLN